MYREMYEIENSCIRQGIIFNDRCTEKCMKLRIAASDKDTEDAADKANYDVYKNKFTIPLDFEMLNSTIPYYQAGLGNRLCYEITFNNYEFQVRHDLELVIQYSMTIFERYLGFV